MGLVIRAGVLHNALEIGQANLGIPPLAVKPAPGAPTAWPATTKIHTMNICCAGEVMVEMAAIGQDGPYQRGIAGDTYNTALYLARAGLSVSYLTRLGTDAHSEAIVRTMVSEGLDTQHVARIPGRQPGLYLIDNDADGERHFSYWRNGAPVRQLFDEPLALDGLSAFFFTGITLAVTRSGTGNLLALLAQLKAQGTRVVFDPNYRAHLWDSPEQAQELTARVLPLVDTALPTLEDETALWGIEDVESCAAHFIGHGVAEVVVKGPELTSFVYEGPVLRAQRQGTAVKALDTTGAGDAFNAGYLAQRLRGACAADALDNAQQLAARVVQHRGAILPKEEV